MCVFLSCSLENLGESLGRQMLWLFVAALIWGVTNPLLKRFTEGFADRKAGGVLDEIRFLLSRPAYLATQATNLTGSVAFFYALRTVDVSVASVVANALAFVITLVTGVMLLGDRAPTPRGWLAVVLILAGVSLCTLSKTT